MKAKQFHEMSTEELKVKLKDLKQELFNLRFQHATGQLANPLTLNTCKKDIARVMTVIRERELNNESKAKA
jgi:large subunit ribosomal protein L29